jgi:hypothetical protein
MCSGRDSSSCSTCDTHLVPFLLVIVLSVLLRYTNYDYPFGIFKLLGAIFRFLNVIDGLFSPGKHLYNVTNNKRTEQFTTLQRGNQNPYIEEEQTKKWPKEKLYETNNNLNNSARKRNIKQHQPVCPFVPFLLVIVLSVLLRYTNYDYPFGIFKLLGAIFRFLNVIDGNNNLNNSARKRNIKQHQPY